MWSHQYPSAQTQISNSVGSPFDDRPAGRRGERPDPVARPDEREAERELDLAAPAGALAVDEAEPLGGSLGLGHPGPDHALDVLHRRRGDVVREPHPLDLLRGLQHPGLVQERRRVLGVRERVEPGLREGRRLADHPVGGLGAERELDPDGLVLLCHRRREVERAERRRPRVALVVARKEPEIGASRPSARRPLATARGRSVPARPRPGKTTASYPFIPQKFVR